VAAIAAFGLSTSGVLVNWDVTSPYLDGLSFALQSYSGSDTVVNTNVITRSFFLRAYDLVHAGADTSDTPDLLPTRAKKTVMMTSPHEIDWNRRMLEASYVRGPDGATVPPDMDWLQRNVGLYDSSDRVAEFPCPPRPDMPVPAYILSGNDTCYAVVIMERSEPDRQPITD